MGTLPDLCTVRSPCIVLQVITAIVRSRIRSITQLPKGITIRSIECIYNVLKNVFLKMYVL